MAANEHVKMAANEHVKMAADMKERLKVEELEENIDELEDVVEDVFPVLILTVILSFLILVVFLLRLYIRWSVPNPCKNRLDGKTVLITGATGGIGKATAVELAKRGARVLLAGKDKPKVEAVARNIRKKTGNNGVNAWTLDLGNLRAIKTFADEFNKAEKSLHILINNAAYMGPKAATDDGLEKSFGVNYLGHFYLTHLLSDKLKKNAPSRVINVVSDGYVAGDLDLDDLALNKGYDPYKAYCRSKLAQVMFNIEYHKQNFPSCVWSFGVHPGACATDLLRSYPGMVGNVLRLIARVMFKSPEDGSQSVVYCAVKDGLRDFSGKLFANCKAMKVKDKAKNAALSRKLWNASAQLCGMDELLLAEDGGIPNGKDEVKEVKDEAGGDTEEKKSQ